MKQAFFGVVVLLALVGAPALSAEPCGLCQAFYPCDWSCEHCVESSAGPGLWEYGGGCWGEIVAGTCGDTGQCGWTGCATIDPLAPVVEAPPMTPAPAVVPAS
ncbi:MAG: hypothetical protein SF066_16740 [Thermoanaerobaculia bacterium]|nr:hypothetical protein [Thermoanaerobaculia bacterium]